MGTLGVIPFKPLSNGSTGLGKALEIVLLDTLLFQAAKKALNDAVLFRRVGSNKLLAQAVVAAGSAKAPALKNESIFASHHWGRTVRPQCTETRQARFLERELGFLGWPLKANSKPATSRS
jgi:hypothetical protein